jgi:cytidine deaminase
MKYLTTEIKYVEYLSNEIPAEYIQLIEEAKRQTENAYAIYSKFHVGAALLLENGKIIGGNNQENSASPSGLCAERTALFYANSQFPNVAVKVLAVAAFTDGKFLTNPITPCGSCRQVMLETENRFDTPIKIILYGTEKTYILDGVTSLLPFSFGKSSLLQK